jgi:hypothetical protein
LNGSDLITDRTYQFLEGNNIIGDLRIGNAGAESWIVKFSQEIKTV